MRLQKLCDPVRVTGSCRLVDYHRHAANQRLTGTHISESDAFLAFVFLHSFFFLKIIDSLHGTRRQAVVDTIYLLSFPPFFPRNCRIL